MVDPLLPFIQQTLEQYPTLPSSRLHRMVVERGYPGGPDHFRRIVRRLRPRNPAEAYLRSFPNGVQMEHAAYIAALVEARCEGRVGRGGTDCATPSLTVRPAWRGQRSGVPTSAALGQLCRVWSTGREARGVCQIVAGSLQVAC